MRSWVEVSLRRIRANYRAVRDVAGAGVEVMPVVKADAYRHGAVEVSRALVHEGVGEGERNSTIASLTGHLLWHGVDPQVALELMLAWNRLRCLVRLC